MERMHWLRIEIGDREIILFKAKADDAALTYFRE